MTKRTETDAEPEALATFAAAARNQGKKPDDVGVTATPETAGKRSNLDADEKDAADILDGNATGDTKRVDAAIERRVKADKRAG